jgi:hypothetical protein
MKPAETLKVKPGIEALVVSRIAQNVGAEEWRVFAALDHFLEEVARRGDERLAWQANFGQR